MEGEVVGDQTVVRGVAMEHSLLGKGTEDKIYNKACNKI